MESAEYKKQYDEYLARAEKALNQACERYLPEGSDVCRAARYSLLGGGKRIRAVLVLAVCDMLHGNAEAAEQFAAAVEMLHCYSLIHDDLPCMDNDDMRRGKPSCHKAFGESTAMLAGDVLLTEASRQSPVRLLPLLSVSTRHRRWAQVQAAEAWYTVRNSI